SCKDCSRLTPMWSVKTASAFCGSVTTLNTPPLVIATARYWSRPPDIGSRYTVLTSERSGLAAEAAVAATAARSTNIFTMSSSYFLAKGSSPRSGLPSLAPVHVMLGDSLNVQGPEDHRDHPLPQ